MLHRSPGAPMSLFDIVCTQFARRLMSNGIQSENYGYKKDFYQAYMKEPSDFDFLEVTTTRLTGSVIVTWGTNQAVFNKNKDGDGYNSSQLGDTTDGAVTKHNHATLDAMIEHACSVFLK
jgi:hypothetical protein